MYIYEYICTFVVSFFFINLSIYMYLYICTYLWARYTNIFMAIKNVAKSVIHVTILLMKPVLLYQKQLDGNIG